MKGDFVFFLSNYVDNQDIGDSKVNLLVHICNCWRLRDNAMILASSIFC